MPWRDSSIVSGSYFGAAYRRPASFMASDENLKQARASLVETQAFDLHSVLLDGRGVALLAFARAHTDTK